MVLEFKQTDVEQRGSRSDQLEAAMRDSRKLTKTVPEKETISESKNRIVFDGAKMRFENNHPMWSMEDGRLWPCPRVEVSDGETGKYLHPLGLGTDNTPQGRIHGAANRWEFRMALLNPIFFAFRGIDREVCPYPMGIFKPTGASVPIGAPLATNTSSTAATRSSRPGLTRR